MAKLVFVLYKKREMSDEEFSDYWRTTHADLAKKIPGVRSYIQNHAISDPAGEPPPYAGVAELVFENDQAMTDGLASDEAGAAIADLPNFTEDTRTQVSIVEEVEVV